jgi:fructokinase
MKFKIVGIGEVLWDMLPSGMKLGGAPANFACHAHALGAQAGVVTRVGNDQLGQDIIKRLQAQGIGCGTVQVDPSAATGMVTVTLAEEGIPQYIIHENAAWDRLAVTPEATAAIQEADAVCFGSLAQRSEPARTSIQHLVESTPAATWRVFDINLRQKYYNLEIIEQSLRLANVLKLNDGELPALAGLLDLAGTTRDMMQALAGGFDLDVVALTRGPAGSLLYQNGQWSDCPSAPTKVVDTVGAGDAFTAALVLGLLRKMSLNDINFFADEVARYVCASAGATPPLPREFAERLATHPAGHSQVTPKGLPINAAI